MIDNKSDAWEADDKKEIQSQSWQTQNFMKSIEKTHHELFDDILGKGSVISEQVA